MLLAKFLTSPAWVAGPMNLGPLVSVIVVLVIVGVCLWLINHYVPMDPPIKTVITVVVVLVLVLWLLRVFGLI